MFPIGFTIVTRTANRLLFGVELARSPEFLQFSIEYTGIMFGGADVIRGYPEFLKDYILERKSGTKKARQTAQRLLRPVIQARIDQEDEYNSTGRSKEWQKIKPSDAIQWILDQAGPKDRVAEELVYRMLAVNVAAIHTSSVSFLESLYCVAAYPEYIPELREEIEAVLRKDGKWTKPGLTAMKKLDSFCNEVLRLCPITASKSSLTRFYPFKYESEGKP